MKNHIWLRQRFANILQKENITLDILKKFKLNIPIGEPCLGELYTERLDILQKLEKELKLESPESTKRLDNITNMQLKKAASMFIYLNSCSNSLRPWFIFFNGLFLNKVPLDQILLSLNTLSKADNPNKDLSQIAKTLLEKTQSLIRRKFNGFFLDPMVNLLPKSS